MVDIEVPEMGSKMAYDRAIVVFSPEGRLYQVEYAQKTVDIAPTAVGITFKGGVALLAAKSINKLLASEYSEKIVKIDDHIAICFCGMAGDARVLIDFARVSSQLNRITFNEPITVQALAKKIANRKQQYTQIGGIRPFGVSFLVAGYDDREHLLETDPAGTMREWKAHAIGHGAKQAKQVLEKEFKPNMSKDQAILLGIKALKQAEKKVSTKNVEIGIIEGNKFRKLDQNEIKKVF